MANTDTSDEKKVESEKIKKEFEEQKKLFDYRYTELLKYRNDAEFVMAKSEQTMQERLDKALKSKSVETREITKERLQNRSKAYGINNQIKVRIIKDKIYSTIVDLQGNTIMKIPYDSEKTEKENFDAVRDKYAKEGFKYEREYIPEDSEPILKGDERKRYVVSYETYYRFGILIYRMVAGRKYEIIYQANYVKSADGSMIISGMSTRYISYQWLIAQIKQDILNKTGLTLEEWNYLSKTRGDIFVEGGIRFRRTRYQYDNKEGKITDEKLDYENEYNFS